MERPGFPWKLPSWTADSCWPGSWVPGSGGRIGRAQALLGKLANVLGERQTVRQIHWGGGTPTFLSAQQMTDLMRVTGEHFRLRDDDTGEYSIEIDPREVRDDTLQVLREIGFNRMSKTTFVTDKLKGYLLTLLIGGLLGGTLLWLIDTLGAGFWLWFWLIFTLFSILTTFFYTSLILPCWTKKIAPAESIGLVLTGPSTLLPRNASTPLS